VIQQCDAGLDEARVCVDQLRLIGPNDFSLQVRRKFTGKINKTK
jgi:hypothetical protein